LFPHPQINLRKSNFQNQKRKIISRGTKQSSELLHTVMTHGCRSQDSLPRTPAGRLGRKQRAATIVASLDLIFSTETPTKI